MAHTPITSFQDIETAWESVLQDSPADTLFLAPQWQKVWWDTFGDGQQTICGYSYLADGGVAAIASLAKSRSTISFMGSQDTFDYNDFPIRPGHEEGFYQTLLEYMDNQDFQEMRLFSLRDSSPTLEVFPDMACSKGYTVEVQEEDVTSGIALPQTWDEYLGLLNKKDRH